MIKITLVGPVFCLLAPASSPILLAVEFGPSWNSFITASPRLLRCKFQTDKFQFNPLEFFIRVKYKILSISQETFHLIFLLFHHTTVQQRPHQHTIPALISTLIEIVSPRPSWKKAKISYQIWQTFSLTYFRDQHFCWQLYSLRKLPDEAECLQGYSWMNSPGPGKCGGLQSQGGNSWGRFFSERFGTFL